MRARGEARRNRLMMSRWVRAPIAAHVRRPAAHATATGWPLFLTSHWTYAPTMPIAPWAKLSTPEPR